jgi:hypothetical protein
VLANDVADACTQHGIPPLWTDDARDHLKEALWQFIHPILPEPHHFAEGGLAAQSPVDEVDALLVFSPLVNGLRVRGSEMNFR